MSLLRRAISLGSGLPSDFVRHLKVPQGPGLAARPCRHAGASSHSAERQRGVGRQAGTPRGRPCRAMESDHDDPASAGHQGSLDFVPNGGIPNGGSVPVHDGAASASAAAGRLGDSAPQPPVRDHTIAFGSTVSTASLRGSCCAFAALEQKTCCSCDCSCSQQSRSPCAPDQVHHCTGHCPELHIRVLMIFYWQAVI